MDYEAKLNHLVPGYRMTGTARILDQADYESREWKDERPRPTWSEIESVILPEPEVPLSVELDAMFMSQPAEVRAKFYREKAAVSLAIQQGDLEVIPHIIAGASVTPDLEPVKNAMLEKVKQKGVK